MLGSQHEDDGLELGALSLVHCGGPSQLQLRKLCGAAVGHVSHLACGERQATQRFRVQLKAWLQCISCLLACSSAGPGALQDRLPQGQQGRHGCTMQLTHSVALNSGI